MSIVDDSCEIAGLFQVHAQDAANGNAWRWMATSAGGSMHANETLFVDGLPAGWAIPI